MFDIGMTNPRKVHEFHVNLIMSDLEVCVVDVLYVNYYVT